MRHILTCTEDPELEVRCDPNAVTLSPPPVLPDDEAIALLSSGPLPADPALPEEYSEAPPDEIVLGEIWVAAAALKVALRDAEKKAQRTRALLLRARAALENSSPLSYQGDNGYNDVLEALNAELGE